MVYEFSKIEYNGVDVWVVTQDSKSTNTDFKRKAICKEIFSYRELHAMLVQAKENNQSRELIDYITSLL